MWQVFQTGLGVYILLLMNHRALNRRHFKRHAAEIDRHRQMIEVGQGMVVATLSMKRVLLGRCMVYSITQKKHAKMLIAMFDAQDAEAKSQCLN